MVIPGRVEHGVIVLEGDVCVPDGTRVSVVIPVAVQTKSWDLVFADELVIESNTRRSDEVEVSKDDLLF